MGVLIDVERVQDDWHKEQWRFYVYERGNCLTVRLDEYAKLERQTKRHSWKPVQKWTTFDRRSVPYIISVERYSVPIPDDVKAEAVQKLIDGMEFV